MTIPLDLCAERVPNRGKLDHFAVSDEVEHASRSAAGVPCLGLCGGGMILLYLFK
jgi:hypothetical protein